jgi:hypothetical protein
MGLVDQGGGLEVGVAYATTRGRGDCVVNGHGKMVRACVRVCVCCVIDRCREAAVVLFW